MRVVNVFRTDPTNVGDWHCGPFRYFDLGGRFFDVLDSLNRKSGAGYPPLPEVPAAHVALGGGGLIAKNFHDAMALLAAWRAGMLSLVAWGIGESEHVDRSDEPVAPYAGGLPDYVGAFDLICVRDVGGVGDFRVEWAPCVICMSPLFDQHGAATREAMTSEHKRTPIRIDGLERMTNDGGYLERKLASWHRPKSSSPIPIHGAYWATLLGQRVAAMPNMSKMYRLRHAPVICGADAWPRYAPHPDAVVECCEASRVFHGRGGGAACRN